MSKVAGYWKALAGTLAPSAVLVIAAVTEGSPGGSTITQAEWITAAATVLITGGAVYAAPKNRTTP